MAVQNSIQNMYLWVYLFETHKESWGSVHTSNPSTWVGGS